MLQIRIFWKTRRKETKTINLYFIQDLCKIVPSDWMTSLYLLYYKLQFQGVRAKKV